MILKNISEVIPKSIHQTTSSKEIYIVDYTNLNNGEVTLLEQSPIDINAVKLTNNNLVKINFWGFEYNALENLPGNYSKQCECIISPESELENPWILFIETKYTNDLKSAFNENNNYPYCMIDQIKDTVDFFRTKEIISKDRRVHAIVSFPNLISEFNSTFFSGDLSIINILHEYNILIRATNKGNIISEKRIKLG